MPTDLAAHIQQIRIHNTHEHQDKEEAWVSGDAGDPAVGFIKGGPRDVLQDLFLNYDWNDLQTAGASAEDIKALLYPDNATLEERWARLAPAWEAMRFTGYGEAVRIHARELYAMEELTPRAMVDAQAKLLQYRRPGERLRLLRDVAGLDHVQVDDFSWGSRTDASGPDFFLYDLSVASLAQGAIDPKAIANATGVDVKDLGSLRNAVEVLFERHAACAIAVKSQHAYARTLAWRQRSDDEASAALAQVLATQEKSPEESRLCVGDWCIDRVAELCARNQLPFKIHTGHYAGNGGMPVQRISAGHLCPLLMKHPRTKFVLMHISYPYQQELLSIAKHFPNVWVDLCWAWSIDPYSGMDFVRRFVHAVPINKLFGYGGDTFWPTRGVAYTLHMRRWMTRALEAEVADGYLSEAEAMGVGTRFLRGNQEAVFDLAGKRAAIRRYLEGENASRGKMSS